MENNKQFTITYYSGKDKKHITRLGKWVEGGRYWTSKSGKAIFTYFDILIKNKTTGSFTESFSVAGKLTG